MFVDKYPLQSIFINFVKSKRIRQRTLSFISGVPCCRISRVINREVNWGISLDEAKKISHAYGLHINEIIKIPAQVLPDIYNQIIEKKT